MGGEKNTAPADEYEALREKLLAEIRRRPGDTLSLMRTCEGLTRMTVAQARPSRRQKEQLSANLEAVIGQFGDFILPPNREATTDN